MLLNKGNCGAKALAQAVISKQLNLSKLITYPTTTLCSGEKISLYCCTFDNDGTVREAPRAAFAAELFEAADAKEEQMAGAS